MCIVEQKSAECEVGTCAVLHYINHLRFSSIVVQRGADLQRHTCGTRHAVLTSKSVICYFHYVWYKIMQNMVGRYTRRRERDCT